MTELRVNHNDQMLVFQGIDSSTCLQSVLPKTKPNGVKSANMSKESLSNYPLNILIHKSLTNRAQTATTFLGQKYSPIQHNSFTTNGVLIGHNFMSKKPKPKTGEIEITEKPEIIKHEDKPTNRGKSAPVATNKYVDNFPVESFIIKPAVKIEIQRKAFWYLSRENTMLNIESTRPDHSIDVNEYLHSNTHTNDGHTYDCKLDRSFKATLSPYTSYNPRNSDKSAIIKKKPVSNLHLHNHNLLPLLWSEELKTSSLFGYTKGKAPFQAVLAAKKHISNIS